MEQSDQEDITEFLGVINSYPELLYQGEFLYQLLNRISFDEFFTQIYNHPEIYSKISSMNEFWLNYLSSKEELSYDDLIVKVNEKNIDNNDKSNINNDNTNNDISNDKINWFYECVRFMYPQYKDYYAVTYHDFLSLLTQNRTSLGHYSFHAWNKEKNILPYWNIKDVIIYNRYFYILFKDGNTMLRRDSDDNIKKTTPSLGNGADMIKHIEKYFLTGIKQIYKLSKYNLFLSNEGILYCVNEYHIDNISIIPFPFPIKSLTNPFERINDEINAVLITDENDNLYLVPGSLYIFTEKRNENDIIFQFIINNPLLTNMIHVTPILLCSGVLLNRFINSIIDTQNIENIKYLKNHPFTITMYYIGGDNLIHRRFYVNYVIAEQQITYDANALHLSLNPSPHDSEDVTNEMKNRISQIEFHRKYDVEICDVKCKELITVFRHNITDRRIYFINMEDNLYGLPLYHIGKYSTHHNVPSTYIINNNYLYYGEILFQQTFKYSHQIYLMFTKLNIDNKLVYLIDERNDTLTLLDDIQIPRDINVIVNDNFKGIIYESKVPNSHVYIPYALFLEYTLHDMIASYVRKENEIIFRLKFQPYIFQTTVKE